MRKKEKETEFKRRDAIYGPEFEDGERYYEPRSRALHAGKRSALTTACLLSYKPHFRFLDAKENTRMSS